MLDSIPVPFQAIVWPLAGAALILALGRLLPNWGRRLLAMGTALASCVVLWSLRGGTAEQAQAVAVVWEPLHFFRMSPTLRADGLSLLCGMALSGVTAATVVSIRGHQPRRTAWHGWMLVALAGSLTATMAANVLALAMGSALLDLALIAIIVSTTTPSDGPTSPSGLGLAVPGIASTLVLLVSALQMDVQVGHASLLSPNLAEEALALVGVAGILRALLFPLHPRGLSAPETAATLLLPVGVGGYLLARVQALVPVLTGQPWIMALAAIALLSGGLLAWSHGAASSNDGQRHPTAPGAGLPARPFGGFWSATLVYQTAYMLAFALLLAAGTPWPLLGLMLCLGALVIWWAGSLETVGADTEARPWVPPPWIAKQIGPRWASVQSYVTKRLPRLPWGKGTARRDFPFSQYGTILLPLIALASLAGLPFTVGARGRWAYYAAWLRRGDPAILIALAADALLCAGLWIAFRTLLEQAGGHRPRPTLELVPTLATFVLILAVVILGIAPGIVSDGLGLAAGMPQPVGSAGSEPPSRGVSVWGLALLYVLPWLLGAWLARVESRLRGYLDRIQAVVSLDWLYRALDWVGRRLVGVVYWLGRVGEGEGWLGWALIILALGYILFASG